MPLSITRPHHMTHMQPRYVYASTLVKTREQDLLSDTQLEMLLTAKSPEDMISALHDTYLAPFLAGRNGSISYALEQSVASARHTLDAIAPEPHLLDVLWMKYDFYNLRTIIKGTHEGRSRDEILESCFTLGLCEPEKLLQAYSNNALFSLDPDIAAAAKEASSYSSGGDIERVIQTHYFATLHKRAVQTRNTFVIQYAEVRIDIFNTLAQLRSLARSTHSQNIHTIHVPGGTLGYSDIETEEKIFSYLSQLSDERTWREAFDNYKKTGSFLSIEKLAEEYIRIFLDRESFELFSLAPLYAYFTAIKNCAQTIQAIWVGKTTGMKERDIRINLRRLHT